MYIRNTTRASAVRNRDKMSPERMRLSYVHHHHHHPQQQQPRMMMNTNNVVMSKPFRKVQVLYYICRSNGQLEHPHFIEVTHLSTQHLLLKDFIDRLIVLRGRSMPCLFSWSCKRSYKNGYVWNDLSDNDIIYPAEGAEYILKGSELIEGCSEQFQQIQVTKKQNPELKCYPKRRSVVVPSQNRETELGFMNRTETYEEEEEEEEVRKNSTSSNKSSSRCSRGVSTEEDEELKTHIPNTNEITVEDTTNYSPPSSSSTVSEKTPTPKPVDHDSVTEPTRSSVLFQLIACGSSNAIRERNAAAQKSIMPAPVASAARKSNCSSNLHRGVLCKNINTAIKMSEEEEDDEINYMSENPRFGNPQSEEKEYFSGSLVESITEHDRVIKATEPSRLKKSSSYNEERSRKSGLGLEPATMDEKNEEEESKKMKKKNMKGHYCIPILTCNNK